MKNNSLKVILILIIIIIALLIILYTKINSSGTKEVLKSNDTVEVKVDLSEETKEISQYIYGINAEGDMDKVKTTSIRQGGNRRSTYNWENNYSNAGRDWKNSSDTYLSDSSIPGYDVLSYVEKANRYNIPYKVTTLQMLGYVSADKNGTVEINEVAPSKRWNKVEFRKKGNLSLNPDLTDGVVYIDEYLNYLIKKLGNSTTSTGIQGYCLDNEPALWDETHSLSHPEQTTPEELIEKSVELAKVIKEADPEADVFGPSLFGTVAYSRFSLDKDKDTDLYKEWENTKNLNEYNWFIDYYLDNMKKESDDYGERLLDYFDIHYYSEACDTPEKLLQASRTLYDPTFIEDSYVGRWYSSELPYLPKIHESINKYFPGTKLAITEYNFRGDGDTIYEAIAEVQYLAVFAKNDVDFAAYWGENCPYIDSAINLYTNCGKDGNVGKYLVESNSDDISKVCSFSATDTVDARLANTLNIILTNNEMDKNEKINVKIENSDINYTSATIYAITSDSTEITYVKNLDSKDIKNNEFSVVMPPVSAYRIVLKR